MAHRVLRYVLTMVFVGAIGVGFSAIMTGCEPKRQKDVHVEKTHKDVIIDEGPVVE